MNVSLPLSSLDLTSELQRGLRRSLPLNMDAVNNVSSALQSSFVRAIFVIIVVRC